MSVRRTESGYQTSFALPGGQRDQHWSLVYGEVELAPAVWKLLEHDGTDVRVLATIHPHALSFAQLQEWLAATIGTEDARQLADAVRAQPPRHLGVPPAAAGANTPRR